MVPLVNYLGYIVFGEGLPVGLPKIPVIVDWPRPTTLTELCGFWGLASFYRRFIKGFSDITSPLSSCRLNQEKTFPLE